MEKEVLNYQSDEKVVKNKKSNEIDKSFQEGKKQFKCNVCSESYGRKGHLSRHMASIHDGKKPFKCEICSATFTLKNDLKTHSTSVHEGKKPSKCDICSAPFALKRYLNAHSASILFLCLFHVFMD